MTYRDPTALYKRATNVVSSIRRVLAAIDIRKFPSPSISCNSQPRLGFHPCYYLGRSINAKE